MPVDMALLKSRGCSSGAYKRVFSGDAINYPPRVRKLVDLIANRARRSIATNLQEWRAYAAIDIAYDVPFQQTTPTLVQNLLCQHLSAAETLKALEGWGLKEDDLYMRVTQPNGDIALVPNPPVFFKIFIPLVKAYVTIRLAKIFNERNLDPLLEYKPLKETSRNQVLCDIITDLINTISTWYGYPSVLRQCIQQMLKYGTMLTFTYEEWDCQEQVVMNEDGSEETVTVKEGLRYHMPHPTRMFCDLMYPTTTINSDTGVSWCGHYTVKTYGDILDNRMYWNRKSIFSGTNWFAYGYGSSYYFQEFFPCVMADSFNLRFGSGVPPSREDKAAWYNNSDRDQAVFLTEFFMKLVPAEWGLGEYDKDGRLVKTYHKPVWHRFTLAGDDTVIWAEPMAYCPSWFMGYQYDQQAGRQSSIALDTIPWQDHVGNILSQIILTAKQNLANVAFYDDQVVNKDDIEMLKNKGEMMYRGMNFVAYDSLRNQRAGLDVRAGLIPVQLTKQSIAELLQMLPTVLNIMERVLQISAQEVGAAASHQQSKAEIVETGSASNNGVVFTASYVDEGIDAWKRQLYDAATAYMDPTISAQVSADIPDLDQHLEELGFQKKGEGSDMVLVTGHKKALRLEGFASSNQGPAVNREKEVAQIIFSTVGTVAGQPELFKKVGAKNLLSLLEEAAKMAGAPRDFKLNMPAEEEGGQEEVEENVRQFVIQTIQQSQQATLKSVSEKIAKPAAQEIAQDNQKIQQLEQVVASLQKIYQVAAAEQEKTAVAAKKLQADTARKDFQAQKSEQRKDAAASAAIRRETAKTQAEIALETQKAAAETHIKTLETAHSSALEAAKVAAAPPKAV